LKATPKNWNAFFAGIPHDPPYVEGFAVAKELAAEHELVYLSGRPDRTRSATEAWLRRHGAPDEQIVLRRNPDRHPIRVLKIGLLRRLAEERPVAVFVDDDPAVCCAAREAGFTVFEATWGRPQPTLFDAQERLGKT
jgi:hypothetical protein